MPLPATTKFSRSPLPTTHTNSNTNSLTIMPQPYKTSSTAISHPRQARAFTDDVLNSPRTTNRYSFSPSPATSPVMTPSVLKELSLPEAPSHPQSAAGSYFPSKSPIAKQISPTMLTSGAAGTGPPPPQSQKGGKANALLLETPFPGLYNDSLSPRNAVVDRLAREERMRQALEERRGSAAFYVQDFGLDREGRDGLHTRQRAVSRWVEPIQRGVKRKIDDIGNYIIQKNKAISSEKESQEAVKEDDDVLLQAKALLGIIMKRQGLNENDVKSLIKAMNPHSEDHQASLLPIKHLKLPDQNKAEQSRTSSGIPSPLSSAKDERPERLQRIVSDHLCPTPTKNAGIERHMPPTPTSLDVPGQNDYPQHRIQDTPASEAPAGYQNTGRIDNSRGFEILRSIEDARYMNRAYSGIQDLSSEVPPKQARPTFDISSHQSALIPPFPYPQRTPSYAPRPYSNQPTQHNPSPHSPYARDPSHPRDSMPASQEGTSMAPLLATLARYGNIPDHFKAALIEALFNQNNVSGDESVGGMRDENLAGYAGLAGVNNSRKRIKVEEDQKAILMEAYNRSAYPTTEERDELRRRLGTTSRSVQIWFQNKRRAVKVEQQSNIQSVENEIRRNSIISILSGGGDLKDIKPLVQQSGPPEPNPQRYFESGRRSFLAISVEHTTRSVAESMITGVKNKEDTVNVKRSTNEVRRRSMGDLTASFVPNKCREVDGVNKVAKLEHQNDMLN